MFDRLCVRDSGSLGAPRRLDLGLLAESLIFYGKVYLVANRAMLTELIQRLGPDLVVRLAEEERIHIAYCNEFSAVYSEDVGTPTERHLFSVAEMPHTAVDELAPQLFIEATGKAGRGRRLAVRFLRHVERIALDRSVADSAHEDARDPSYVSSAIETALRSLAPAYALPRDYAFDLEPVAENRYRVSTNLDFPSATWAFRQQSRVSDVTITPALLLSCLAAVHEDIAFAGLFESDIATSTLASRLLQLKFTSLVQGREALEAQIGAFEDWVFKHSRAIADAVNSGRVSFGDVLDVVDRSHHFRKWLDGQPPDADLQRAYFQECTKETKLDRLPGAFARWVLVTGASTAASTAAGLLLAGPLGIGAGIATGIAIGGADFAAERIRQGWKPNHFVDHELRRLIE